MPIELKLGQLAEALQRDIKARKAAVNKGIGAAALRGRALLTGKTPTGATSAMRAAWKVRNARGANGQFASGYVIENSAPYAGIVELGARPHKVSPQGILAIQFWAQRKLGMDAREANALAHGVAHKLATEGQKGTYYVEKSLPELSLILDAEIIRYLTTAVK